MTTALLYQADVGAAPLDNETLFTRSKYIEVGAEYEYSDNTYKVTNGEQSGTTSLGDIELGYEQLGKSNEIAINYTAEYQKQSESEDGESSSWIGNTTISQDLFSENLVFNLEHTRQRYIIDQNIAGIEDNQSERDLLDLGLQWFIPYTERTTFVLGVAHEEVWFNDTGSTDSNSNTGQVSWQYALNPEVQLQLSYFGTENNFDEDDLDYNEHILDAQITSQYRLGTYSFNMGRTWIQGSDNDYNDLQYGMSIDALLGRHLLALNLSRSFTNSSAQVGESNELDFTENNLFWRTSVSLTHQYTMLDERLVSNMRLYFNNDENAFTIDSDTTEDRDRYGIYGQLLWSLTEKLSSSISADYSEADITTGGKRQYLEAEIYGRYNFTDSLYIQFTVALEKQGNDQDTLSYPPYTELSYATRIAYRY
ncbi:MAG: hypothetical protein WBM99_06250 [Psychromonas sp.]